MKFLVLVPVAFLLIFLSACSRKGTSVEVRSPSGENFYVRFLFEKDGCRVYRFVDGGTYYYSTCNNGTYWEESCGKGCVMKVGVQ